MRFTASVCGFSTFARNPRDLISAHARKATIACPAFVVVCLLIVHTFLTPFRKTIVHAGYHAWDSDFLGKR